MHGHKAPGADERGGKRQFQGCGGKSRLYAVGREPHDLLAGGGAGLSSAAARPLRRASVRRGRAAARRGALAAFGRGAAAPDGRLDPRARSGHGAHRRLHLGRRALAAAGPEGVPARLSQRGIQAAQRRLSRRERVALRRQRGHRLRRAALRAQMRDDRADGGQAAGHPAEGQPLRQLSALSADGVRERALHLAAAVLRPRRAARARGRGREAERALLHQGRLRHHRHGRAGPGHEHHAGATPEGAARRASDAAAGAGGQAHDRHRLRRRLAPRPRHSF